MVGRAGSVAGGQAGRDHDWWVGGQGVCLLRHLAGLRLRAGSRGACLHGVTRPALPVLPRLPALPARLQSRTIPLRPFSAELGTGDLQVLMADESVPAVWENRWDGEWGCFGVGLLQGWMPWLTPPRPRSLLGCVCTLLLAPPTTLFACQCRGPRRDAGARAAAHRAARGGVGPPGPRPPGPALLAVRPGTRGAGADAAPAAGAGARASPVRNLEAARLPRARAASACFACRRCRRCCCCMCHKPPTRPL